MATIDEIFAAMPDAPAGGTHELLIIDPDTRQIEVPEIESIFGVVTDGNAEKKYFQCPRYVGKGIDLAACKLRIAFQNASNTEDGRDGYLVQDLAEKDGFVYFSWELSEKVCLFQGTVQFAVCAMQGSTVVWNTDAAEGTVLGGLPYNGEIVQTEMSDIIAQLIALVEAQSAAVEAVGAEQVQNVQAAGAAAVAEINAAAANAATAIVCEAEGTTIQVANASDRPLQGLRIFGRSAQDGTPSPDSPVEIVSTDPTTVVLVGKNVLSNNYTDWFMRGSYLFFKVQDAEQDVTISITDKDTSVDVTGCYIGLTKDMDDPNAAYTWPLNAGNVVAKEATRNYNYAIMYPYTEETFTKIFNRFFVQVEINGPATAYEPYEDAQTLALPNSLPGIPVASGGNYTDADGQQWICDEVDLGRGVHVQRVALDTLTTATYYASDRLYCKLTSGTSKEDLICICSHAQKGIAFGNGAVGAYTSCVLGPSVLPDSVTDKATGQTWIDQQISAGTPVTVGYILTEPIETALTEAELAAFAALHSVKPTTTILNDSGAHMAVEYVADTKLYIDGKLAELVAAMNA